MKMKENEGGMVDGGGRRKTAGRRGEEENSCTLCHPVLNLETLRNHIRGVRRKVVVLPLPSLRFPVYPKQPKVQTHQLPEPRQTAATRNAVIYRTATRLDPQRSNVHVDDDDATGDHGEGGPVGHESTSDEK